MKRRVEHENHERWLVSYADFITLLFAFFVVLYASSNADKEKTRQVAESVRAALSQGPLSAAVASMLGHPRPGQAHKGEATPAGVEKAAPGPPAADLAQSLEVLRRGLSAELETG